jgi:hypothetical protein
MHEVFNLLNGVLTDVLLRERACPCSCPALQALAPSTVQAALPHQPMPGPSPAWVAQPAAQPATLATP